jgi:cytochrome c oxidase subunit 4
MSDGTAAHDDHGHHIVPVKMYLGVIVYLFFMMFLTVFMAFQDIGPVLNPLIAVGIAVGKAIAIVLIFMNVFFSTRLTKIFVAGAFFWLFFLFGMIIIDFLSRRLVTTPDPWG